MNYNSYSCRNHSKARIQRGKFIQQSSRRKGAVSNKHPVSLYASNGRGNVFRIVTDNILNATCGFMDNLLLYLYKMCKSSGHIKSQTSKYLKGDWDLTGGFSGGPLVEYISGSGYVAIGIHKDGSTVDGSQYPTSYTGALRITQSLYTLFLSYRGE